MKRDGNHAQYSHGIQTHGIQCKINHNFRNSLCQFGEIQ